jgi:CRISPR-associated endoribonuclease Cas6
MRNPVKKQGKRGFDSLLQCDRKLPIPADTSCWWRISLLDDSLFGNLAKLWLNLNPSQPWHLGSANLYITSVLGTAQSTQPWANFAPYSQIYENASDCDRLIKFQLCTPTAFRQGKFDSPLPTAECVFKSLLARWNTYSSIPLSAEMLEYIFPSSFQISSEAVKNYNGHFIGCIGDISFRILGDPEPSVIKQINALADFALYSGIGRKTTMGMGMVRRVV